jgi:endoglucanase
MSKTTTALVITTMVLAVVSGCDSFMTGKQNTKSAKIDAFEMNKLLGRGVNMGNALEAPNEGAWGVVLKEEYFDIIKQASFNSVRIPVRWSAHALAEPPYTIDPNFMKRVDWAVNCALSRKMPVMLNVHNYPELLNDPVNHRERFLAIWQQLAEHYKNYPQTLLFEPINEPSGKLRGGDLNTLLKQTIAVIRQSNPDRIIIAGSAWNVIGTLTSLKLPAEDRNIIVSIHYYDPLEFTHQGAPFITDRDANAWMGTKWPRNNKDEERVIKDFNTAATWGKQNNRPINLGEFGSYKKADMESRARYAKFVADTAARYGMSMLYWDFCAEFALYDRDTKSWNKPLLDAIIPQKQ